MFGRLYPLALCFQKSKNFRPGHRFFAGHQEDRIVDGSRVMNNLSNVLERDSGQQSAGMTNFMEIGDGWTAFR